MNQVSISLGDWVDLRIVDDELFIVQTNEGGTKVRQTISLGRATTARFDDLKSYLNRLSVHSVGGLENDL